MSTEETRSVVEGYLADHGPEWLSERIVFQDMTKPEPMRGRSEVSAFVRRFYIDVFGGGRVEETRLTAEGHRVVAEWLFRGRHAGSLLGETPTGREVEVPMACVYEVMAGEITAARLYYDQSTLLRQLGAGAALAIGRA